MAAALRPRREHIQLSRRCDLAFAARRERGKGTQSLPRVRAHAVGRRARPVSELSRAGRRCRGCGARIPARDFFLEVLGGVCSCACAYAFGGETARAALTFAVLGILTVVAFMDIDTLEIYDRFPALLLVCGAAAQFVFPGPGIKSRLLGCVIVSLPMLLLALVVPGGFGGGDIKLMAGAGFFLGARLTVVAAFLGILLGGGFGALLLAAKKADRKTRFAFGPFLCIGIAAAMFFGERLADWYIGLL